MGTVLRKEARGRNDRKGGKVADEALKMGYIHVTLEERENLKDLKLSRKGKTAEEIEVEEESEEAREAREKREEIRKEVRRGRVKRCNDDCAHSYFPIRRSRPN